MAPFPNLFVRGRSARKNAAQAPRNLADHVASLGGVHPLRVHADLLARNTLLNVLGQLLPGMVALVAIPFIIRGLGKDAFGIFSLALMVLGYLGSSRASKREFLRITSSGSTNVGKYLTTAESRLGSGEEVGARKR